MKNILVTGCAGFIGSSVVDFLLLQGYHVVGVDNFDPFYPKEIKQKNLSEALKHPSFKFYELNICNGLSSVMQEIDVVIHLAAKAGVRPSIENPLDYIETNVYGTQQVLNFMKERNIKKLLFASSSSVYGNNKRIPFAESDPVDNPISPYASTKKSAELLTHTFHHLFNINVINLRFFTVYGPRQRSDLAIHKFVKAITEKKPVELYGLGDTARDYTYITDIVDGIFKAMHFVMNNNDVYLTLNLGNSTPVKLIDLVNVIYQELESEPYIEYKSMQPGDVEITYADITKAKEILNYHPQTSLKNGISKFSEWYRQHFPN
jgi:nucleoside-diphosphate-sugar epimerase